MGPVDLQKKVIKTKIEFNSAKPWFSAPPMTPLFHRHCWDLCLCVEGIVMTYILWNGWLHRGVLSVVVQGRFA